MELTLTDSTTVKGLIYCTDDISQSIVIQRSLVHTTLSSEIIVVHADSVKEKKSIELPDKTDNNNEEEGGTSSEDNIQKYGVANLAEVRGKVMNVSRRALEEREKRALRLAEEGFSHVNQKVSL